MLAERAVSEAPRSMRTIKKDLKRIYALLGWKKKQAGRTNQLTLRNGFFFDNHVLALRLDIGSDFFLNCKFNHHFFGISRG